MTIRIIPVDLKIYTIYQMKHTILFLLLINLLLTGCSTVSSLRMELVQPSSEILSSDIQSLLLVNRAVDKSYTDDPADSIQIRFYKAQFTVDTLIRDLKAADTLLQVLGTLLYESGRYDIVIPEDRFIMKDTVNPYSEVMKWEQVDQLSKTFNTDAVLSLENFRTNVITSYDRSTLFNPVTEEFSSIFTAKMKIGYSAHFRLYNPITRSSLNNYLFNDTLIWENYDYDLKNLFLQFTYVKQGLTEAGIDASLQLSERIAPAWIDSRRAYFSKGSTVLRQTSSLVKAHEWENALDIWLEQTNKTKSKTLLSKFEFNIALAYEMLGDIEEAIRWGIRSHETMYRPLTYRYLKVLNERKEVIKQMNEGS